MIMITFSLFAGLCRNFCRLFRGRRSIITIFVHVHIGVVGDLSVSPMISPWCRHVFLYKTGYLVGHWRFTLAFVLHSLLLSLMTIWYIRHLKYTVCLNHQIFTMPVTPGCAWPTGTSTSSTHTNNYGTTQETGKTHSIASWSPCLWTGIFERNKNLNFRKPVTDELNARCFENVPETLQYP